MYLFILIDITLLRLIRQEVDNNEIHGLKKARMDHKSLTYFLQTIASIFSRATRGQSLKLVELLKGYEEALR